MHYFRNMSSASGGKTPPVFRRGLRWGTSVSRLLICPPLEKKSCVCYARYRHQSSVFCLRRHNAAGLLILITPHNHAKCSAEWWRVVSGLTWAGEILRELPITSSWSTMTWSRYCAEIEWRLTWTSLLSLPPHSPSPNLSLHLSLLSWSFCLSVCLYACYSFAISRNKAKVMNHENQVSESTTST